MRFKDLHLKLKAVGKGRFFKRNDDKKEFENTKKPSWMTPISHGYHVVEDRSEDGHSDSVVVQREETEGVQFCFFGVFDARIGDEVVKYMQSHLFDKKPKEIRKISKATMRKAHISARAKVREAEEKCQGGSTCVMVINGEKLVISNMGDYRAILCIDGMAHTISKKQQQKFKSHWSLKLFSGAFLLPKVCLWSSNTGNNNAAVTKSSKSSQLVVASKEIDVDCEFIILASSGIWEVMKNQEAVDLIKHIEHPQEAAECLVKEAITRMSRSSISCLVIRFD